MWRDNGRNRGGFTLIEILIVMVILVFVTGVVAPVAFRNVEKFKRLLARRGQLNLRREAQFISFIKDRPCKVEKDKIICGGKTYRSLKDVVK